MRVRHPRVEARHLQDIKAAGIDPETQLIDGQLATWERRLGSPLEGRDETLIQMLAAQAPSRYEVAEYLHPYYLARANVVRMQQMSADRQRFDPSDIVVATDLAGIGDPRVESEWPALHLEVQGDLTAQDPDSVIWVPLATVKQLAVVAEVVAHRLVAPAGNLPSFIEALASHLPWTSVLDLLRRGHQAVMTTDAHEAWEVLEIAWLTFMIGHEAGHIYYRHTGTRPLSGIFIGQPPVPTGWAEEASADSAGIAAVWDEMNANQHISIDVSWLGPVLSLAYHSGREAARPLSDIGSRPACDAWLFRLEMSLRSLGASLRGNGFELERIARTLGAVAPIAAGVYEFVRTGGDLSRMNKPSGEPGEVIYARLASAALAEIKLAEVPR